MSAYRLLLRLYPRPFRRRYGGEMADVFERLRERTRRERGWVGLACLWARTVADALVSGTAERLYGRTVDQRGHRNGEGTMMGTIQEVGQAIRALRRAPGYAGAFVLTLGLAIGVNSAVFSVVNGVLLQPLPFKDAERILYLKQPVGALAVENTLFSFIEVDDYRSASSTIDEFVEFGDWEFTVVSGSSEPHRAVGGLVTSNYFGVLGMRPVRGRLLNAQDDVRGAEAVMLLTDTYWERALGRDPSIVGQVLDLSSGSTIPTRVVGVLEPGFHYTGSRRPDFFVNYAANAHYSGASMRDSRGHRMTDVFARMAPGATFATARAELESIAERIHRAHRDDYPADQGFGLEVVPWKAELTSEGRSTFLFLMGTVGLVLLLAAANVTNLTLTRLIRKEAELATRAALGASRADLRVQLTAEHAVLGLIGGGLGIVLAFASRSSLVAYASRFTVRAQEIGVDWTVLGATLGGGMALACLLAWLPGLPVAPDVGRVASAQSRATDTRWRKRLQRGLVMGQLALSFTLLTGTGLLVRSLIELTSVDPGFHTEAILTMRTPRGENGGQGASDDPAWENALSEIRGYPGVRAAAVASWAPLASSEPTAIGVRIDDRETGDDVTHLIASNNVSAGYFELLGIPLLAGRYFDDSDAEDGAPVVILNESMARAHFGETDAVGRRIAFTHTMTSFSGSQNVFRGEWCEIVGVVADSREHGVQRTGDQTYYRPAAQTSWGPAVLVAHQGDASPITQHVREVIHRMQPDRAVEEVQTLASLLEQDVAPSRLNAMLFGSFAALALVIAALGVFGTLAFSVSQRVREFGIRMAVGADHGSVLRRVLGEGLLLVVVALVIGAGAALVLGRFLAGLLFQVGPVDAMSMVTAAAVLGAVALGATLLPAVRATRIHPSEALRGE